MPVGKRWTFLADKGYDGDVIREELLIDGVRPVIPPKANRDPATLRHIKTATASSKCSIGSSSSAELPPATTKRELPSKRSSRWPPQKIGCRTSRSAFSSPLTLRRQSVRRLMKSMSLAHGF